MSDAVDEAEYAKNIAFLQRLVRKHEQSAERMRALKEESANVSKGLVDRICAYGVALSDIQPVLLDDMATHGNLTGQVETFGIQCLVEDEFFGMTPDVFAHHPLAAFFKPLYEGPFFGDSRVMGYTPKTFSRNGRNAAGMQIDRIVLQHRDIPDRPCNNCVVMLVMCTTVKSRSGEQLPEYYAVYVTIHSASGMDRIKVFIADFCSSPLTEAALFRFTAQSYNGASTF